MRSFQSPLLRNFDSHRCALVSPHAVSRIGPSRMDNDKCPPRAKMRLCGEAASGANRTRDQGARGSASIVRPTPLILICGTAMLSAVARRAGSFLQRVRISDDVLPISFAAEIDEHLVTAQAASGHLGGLRPVCGRTASKHRLSWRRRYGKTRNSTLVAPWRS